MIKGLESLLIGSANAKTLAAFYREKVGLKQTAEMEIGDKDEKGFEFELGKGPGIFITDHSEVSGKSPNPQRVIFNLETTNMEEDAKTLENAGVKVVTETYHVESYGLITTFEDVDGNYFQLVQVKEAE